MRTILTSRAFITQARLEPVVDGLAASGLRIVYLDDLRETVSAWNKIAGLLLRRRPLVARKADWLVNGVSLAAGDSAILDAPGHVELGVSGSEAELYAVWLTAP